MRFVVLHHTAWPGKPDHFDLLIQVHDGAENDRFLKAFATQSNVFPVPSQRDEARRGSRMSSEEDHRIAYLTYQGPVGGGRGRVVRVDEGECEHVQAPTRDELKCLLKGQRLNGIFRLHRMEQEGWVIEQVIQTDYAGAH